MLFGNAVQAQAEHLRAFEHVGQPAGTFAERGQQVGQRGHDLAQFAEEPVHRFVAIKCAEGTARR
jgi:hypothetical protein